MAVSLWLAQKRDVNLIICYGDIIFDPSILEDLIAAEGDIVLAVDNRGGNYDAEDEKVKLSRGMVQRCSKDIPDDEADGEFIGLAKVSRRGARRLWFELGRLVRHEQKMTFLSEVFEQMAADGYAIGVCNLDGRPWNDNDNLADLGESREKVYPRIRDSRQISDTKVKR
jgi:choline kinase